MLMKPADDWYYKTQRGQRNSTVRPRSLRNMGRRLANEIRPRKMKVDVSGRSDEGPSGRGLANLESRGASGRVRSLSEGMRLGVCWGRQRSGPGGPGGQVSSAFPAGLTAAGRLELGHGGQAGRTGPWARSDPRAARPGSAYLHSLLRLKIPFELNC